jgi:hypothetical protein
MIDIPNDVPKYRKKSRARPPAKATHKHVYEPCLLEEFVEWYLKPHLRKSDETKLEFASYCPVCGKVGDMERDRWWTTVKKHNGSHSYLEHVYTDEGKKELDPATRTLPVFRVGEEWNCKFVNIEEVV